MADEHLNNSPETWKAIPGFEGYEVSDQGRIRSYWKRTGVKGIGQGRRGTTCILGNRPQIKNLFCHPISGYMMVGLFHANRGYVHRLVLLAFVGPCPPGMECCHNNGDKENNFLKNLRWDTKESNVKDGHTHGTIACGERVPQARFTENQIIEIRHLYSNGFTQTEIGKIFDASHKVIHKIVHRQSWKHI